MFAGLFLFWSFREFTLSLLLLLGTPFMDLALNTFGVLLLTDYPLVFILLFLQPIFCVLPLVHRLDLQLLHVLTHLLEYPLVVTGAGLFAIRRSDNI